MVAIVGKRVGADVQLVDEYFAVDNSGIGVLDIGFAEPERFYLGTFQNYAGFIVIFDEIIVPGPAVDGDRSFGFFFH
jgi:hypothetical protein